MIGRRPWSCQRATGFLRFYNGQRDVPRYRLSLSYTNGRVWYTITMLYLGILGTTETLYYIMANVAGLHDPIALEFERRTIAYRYCVDAILI